MKNLEKVIERTFKINHDKELTNMLTPLCAGVVDCKYGYVAYAENNGKFFIEGDWSNSMKEVEQWLGLREELRVFIQKYQPRQLTDIMFFLDAYNICKSCNGFEFRTIYDCQFQKNRIVDNILRDSHGFLIWTYQLDNLLRLFFFDHRQVYEIRDGLRNALPNRNKKEFCDMVRKLTLGRGLNLYDVISERGLITGRICVRPPRFRWAYNLFNAIKDDLLKRDGLFIKKGDKMSDFDLIQAKLYLCNDKCKSIVNDRSVGIIPRGIGGELENPDLMVVGLSPDQCDATERFLYKEYIKNDATLISRFTNHCLLDPGDQKNNYLNKLVELFKDIFGEDHFMERIYITNLVKCEPVINGVVDIKTQEHCYEKFLQKEIELLQPKVILALGVKAFRFLNSRGIHNTIKCPHPSPANVRGAKFWCTKSDERQGLIQAIKEAL